MPPVLTSEYPRLVEVWDAGLSRGLVILCLAPFGFKEICELAERHLGGSPLQTSVICP